MIMTLAALFGTLLLTLGHCPSAELALLLRTVFVGSLSFSRILTLFTTPVV